MDAYTPYPVEGLPVEVYKRSTRVPFVVLIGGLIGEAVGFFMQYFSWRSTTVQCGRPPAS